MVNWQTYTIANLNLFATIIFLLGYVSLKITSDMISSTSIRVLIWINSVWWRCSKGNKVIFFKLTKMIKMIVTPKSWMSKFSTYLTNRTWSFIWIIWPPSIRKITLRGISSTRICPTTLTISSFLARVSSSIVFIAYYNIGSISCWRNLKISIMVFHLLFITQHIGIQIIQWNRLHLCEDGHDKRIILWFKSQEHIGYNLFFL